MEGEFYVYILQGKKKKYIGITSNMKRRLDSHNQSFSVFTKQGGPWVLIWKSKSYSHKEALMLERLMKKQKGGLGLETLMRMHEGS